MLKIYQFLFFVLFVSATKADVCPDSIAQGVQDALVNKDIDTPPNMDASVTVSITRLTMLDEPKGTPDDQWNAEIDASFKQSWSDPRFEFEVSHDCDSVIARGQLAQKMWTPKLDGWDKAESTEITIYSDGRVERVDVGRDIGIPCRELSESESADWGSTTVCDLELEFMEPSANGKLKEITDESSGLIDGRMFSYRISTAAKPNQLAAELQLHTSWCWHAVYLGFPTALGVILAIGSMLPSVGKLTARLLLLIASFAIIIALAIYHAVDVRDQLQVYIKAPEIWFAGCLLFPCLVLLEQLFVICIARSADTPELDITKESAEMRAARVTRRIDALFVTALIIAYGVFVALFVLHYVLNLFRKFIDWLPF